VFYNIFKISIDIANLSNHTALCSTVPFNSQSQSCLLCSPPIMENMRSNYNSKESHWPKFHQRLIL